MIDAAVILFREGLESLVILSKARAAWWYILIGAAVSVALGLALSTLAHQVIIIRGIASLAAAALIFYMLIEEEGSHKLVLVAVIREGMEAALFFTAIPPGEIIPGALMGSAGVLVAGILIFKVGVKAHWFFTFATVFLFFLCIKLVGVGVYDLQLGRVVPATPIYELPTIKDVGFYPTGETILAQLLALWAIAAAWRWRDLIR